MFRSAETTVVTKPLPSAERKDLGPVFGNASSLKSLIKRKVEKNCLDELQRQFADDVVAKGQDES